MTHATLRVSRFMFMNLPKSHIYDKTDTTGKIVETYVSSSFETNSYGGKRKCFKKGSMMNELFLLVVNFISSIASPK